MDRDTFLGEFKGYTDKMYETARKKNADYGGETDPWKNFREFGKKGILVRMSDKFARLRTAIWEERAFQVDETLQDTLVDLAVYSLILAIWADEEKAQRPKTLRERIYAQEGPVQTTYGTLVPRQVVDKLAEAVRRTDEMQAQNIKNIFYSNSPAAGFDD